MSREREGEAGARKRAALAALLAREAEGARTAPASFSQQRLWFLDQLDPGSAVYNVVQAFRVRGDLDRAALRRALEGVVARHDALRTTFTSVDGRPLQVVGRGAWTGLEELDLAGVPADGREAAARRAVGEQAERPFDLSRGPLFRCALVETGARERVLLLTMHHIVSDGWSLGVLLRELGALYSKHAGRGGAELPALSAQYADFALRQAAQLRGERLDTLLEYWRTRLRDVPQLWLPSDRPRPPAQTFRGRRTPVALGPELSDEVRGLARREGITPFMLLLAAFQALLHRHTGQTDIPVGSPIANRTSADLEGLIGFFVNTLVLRTDLSGDPSFKDLVRRVRDVALGAYAHQDMPFERLVDELQPERTLDRNPLFQVAFALQNAPAEPLALAGLDVEPFEPERRLSKLDLTVSLADDGDDIRGWLEYSTDLYDGETVARFWGHYRHLLEQLVAGPEQRISEPRLLTGDERARLVEWNATRTGYPDDRSIAQLFEERAKQTPEAIAVALGAEEWSYARLNRQANRLAHRLRRFGVGPDSRVGVCLERSPEMIASLLGILKAGGAYVPLDPSYPAARLAMMVADAELSLLISDSRLAAALPESSGESLLLDRDAGLISEESADDPAVASGPEHLAYVTYTSGSTGKPKGVEVRQRGVTRLLFGQGYARLGREERVLQLAPVAFDASTLEIWGALLHGGCCVLYPEGVPTARDLGEVLSRHRVTTLWLTASLFNAVIDESPEVLRGVRQLLIGGEALSVPHVRRALSALPGTAITNGYGPTEATTFACTHRITASDVEGEGSIPIGRPIANTTIHLLDERLEPVPVGIPGELYIGGPGVARGYLKHPVLTAERFVPDPFGGEPGQRLYRTGDLARHRADGTVEFLGRTDFQVKVRGFRIELGEVEQALRSHPAVADAVAVVRRQGDAEKSLVAYLVPPDGGEPATEDLRRVLKATLPAYMVPAALVWLPELPLTPNGKVDRQALPDPETPEAPLAAAQPRNPLEEGVAEIFSRLLGRPVVGIGDDFFELGGHSLLATQVISRLRSTFQVEIPLRSLFEAPTVAGLAARVEAARRQDAGGTPPRMGRASRTGELPLSFAQQRLWFLDQLGAGAAYNIPWALRLSGELDSPALEASLAEVVRRHDVLRTVFPAVQGRPVQRILPSLSLALDAVDLRERPVDAREDEAQRLAAEEAQRPFELSRGPLVRAKLLQLADGDHVLLLTMHHIVADGWSMGVLTRELVSHYGALRSRRRPELGELEFQYADFACWQRGWLRDEALERQLDYWRGRLADLPRLDLVTDRPRPAVQTFRGARHTFQLAPGLAEQLRALCRAEGATLFMVMLAGFKALLSRYTGQVDVGIGSPIANRHHRELEELIGFFVNSLVMRTDLSGSPTFRELIGRVRETALQAYDHQDLPFEKLVEELDPERDLGQNPLFQVVFAVQNAPWEALELPGLTVRPFPRRHVTTRFDLEAHVWEDGDRMTVVLVYNTDLFDSARVEAMGRHYVQLLEDAVARPGARLSELALMDDEERRRMLAVSAGPAHDHPLETPVHERVEAQAQRTPEAPAVVSGERALSYGELNRRANRLAHHLRKQGVGPETIVGVCMTRSLELVVGLLGTLKAGAAYLPIDPDYPPERIAFMLADARPPVLLTQSHLLAGLPRHEARVVALDGEGATFADQPDVDPGPVAAAQNLAYVIYTSGSTGRPKGVSVGHRGLSNLASWHCRVYGLDSSARTTQLASPAFDASVWEVWPTLVSGASLHLPSEEVRLSPPALVSWLKESAIGHTFLPTPLAELVLREPGVGDLPLRYLLTGGDRLHRVESVALGFRLVNHYGPTEDTVVTTAGEVEVGAPGDPPIGGPIDNTQVYVLDESMELVPFGVPGELYVGGDGLARGYLERPGLTAERFVPSPFGREGARLYRTGDRVRWRDDGTIEFLGRTDAQVKIRGFRIELGEIEASMREHPGVGDAAAVIRGGADGERRLVGYVVPGSSPGTDAGRGPSEREDRVQQWRNVYESVVYNRLAEETGDATLNLAGWNSTYTGRPIPPGEMREQVDQTVDRVLASAPRRVLEIGCGTGMLLFRIAPHCERYVGADFSAAALDYVRDQLQALPAGLPQVSLTERRAEDFSGFEPGSFDLVLLNSVVQYFPDAGYLSEVLEGAARVLAPGGRILVGDVRHLPLMPVFASSVQLFQAPPSSDRSRLRERVQEHLAQEQELAVHPRFFEDLKQRVPSITHVQVTPKRGRARNELCVYRFDAILHVGREPERVEPEEWLDWDAAGLSLARLRERFAPNGRAAVGLRRVPNGRCARDARDAAWLAEERDGPRPLGDAGGGVDPEEIWALGEELGWSVELSWIAGDPEGRFDVVLSRGAPAAVAGAFPVPPEAPVELANNPLKGTRARGLVAQVRAHLRARLPDYMVPAAFAVLESLPLSPNGKVDRGALPDPDASAAGELRPPRNRTEEVLARLWSRVLSVPEVGAETSFFDLGGHSLLAARLLADVHEELGVELPIRCLFETPTVAGLARQIDQRRGEAAPSRPALQRRTADGDAPLSSAQQRLWFVNQLEPGNPAYNMPFAFRLRGRLDSTALRRALAEVVRRHEVLRTSFPLVDEEPVQRVWPAPEELPELVELGPSGDADAELRGLLEAEARHCFDLGSAPPCRMRLLALGAEDHVLQITLHHVNFDGWSLGVLFEELSALYPALAAGHPSPLAEPAVQYGDFAAWQRSWLASPEVEREEEYWRSRLRGAASELRLPFDRPRSGGSAGRGGYVRFVLSRDASAGLAALGREEDATKYMTLLTALSVLLSRYTGQTDLLLGTPIANRGASELEGLIGLVLNTIVLRVNLEGNPSGREALRRVREAALGAFAHQELPFERMVEILQPERTPGSAPPVQVMFNLLAFGERRLSLPGVDVEPLAPVVVGPKVDLNVLVEETAEELRGAIVYDASLFDAPTVDRLSEAFVTVAGGLAADPEAPISTLPVVAAVSREVLIGDFNERDDWR